MSLSSQRIAEVISGELGRWLHSRGFRREGRTFRRWDGPFCLIVNVQASTGNSWEAARFYINLAVYHDEKASPLGRPKEWQGYSRRRLEPLGCGWWTLKPETDLLAVSAEVATLLEKVGLPWLTQEQTKLAAYRDVVRAAGGGPRNLPA